MAQYNTKNQSSLVSRRWFTDIDTNMNLHPESKDLILKFDVNAVKRSLRNILQTNHYERPFKPSFGANLRQMLFELASNETKVMKRRIIDSITKAEPRVVIHNINVSVVKTNLNLTLLFNIVNNKGRHQLDVIVERVR